MQHILVIELLLRLASLVRSLSAPANVGLIDVLGFDVDSWGLYVVRAVQGETTGVHPAITHNMIKVISVSALWGLDLYGAPQGNVA